MKRDELIKLFCKLEVDYGNRTFTNYEREVLKAAIDKSNSWDELFSVAVGSLSLGNGDML